MKYRLVIFDLDGTVLDTLGDLADAVNHALTVSCLPERTVDQVRSFVGDGIRKLIERAVPVGTDAEWIDRVFAEFKAYYKTHNAVKTRPYDGILHLLTVLRDQGVLLALVSNKADFAVQDLCDRFFPGLFDVAVGERDGIPRKPAPDSVNCVLSQLALSCTDAVYVGDSEVDIETARNAGMECVCVAWGFRDMAFLMERGAIRIAADPQSLYELLE